MPKAVASRGDQEGRAVGQGSGAGDGGSAGLPMPKPLRISLLTVVRLELPMIRSCGLPMIERAGRCDKKVRCLDDHARGFPGGVRIRKGNVTDGKADRSRRGIIAVGKNGGP